MGYTAVADGGQQDRAQRESRREGPIGSVRGDWSDSLANEYHGSAVAQD